MAEFSGREGELQLAQAAGEAGTAGKAGADAESAATNAAPQAADDCVVTAEGAEITIPVLANDVDPEGAPLNLLSVSQPESGFVGINADGTLTFAAEEPGLEMMRYQIGDGAGGNASADVVAFVAPAEVSEGARSILAGVDEPTLADIARACVAPTALDQVVVQGGTVSVGQIEPGQHIRVESEAGQQVELLDPAFRDASYFVVDGGLLVITNDGRTAFLADFVSASQAADPVTLQVAGGPPVEGDVLLEGLQPIVVPARGEDAVASVPAPEAGLLLAHGGGAGFTPYDPGAFPPGFDPLGPLPPTELGFGEPPIIDANVDDFLAAGLDDGDGGPGDGGPGDGGPGDGGPGDGGPGDGGPGDGGPGDGGPGDGGPGDGGPGDGGPGDGGPGDGGPGDGGVADVAIVFQDEVAQFVNTLGVYLIGPNGEIQDPQIVFPEIEHAEALAGVGLTRPGGGPLEPGDQVLLSSLYPDQLEPGTEFGLFLISDGFRDNDELTGELAFVDENGNPATIFTPNPQLVQIMPDGSMEEVEGFVFHTVDPTPGTPLENPLNPGGGGQSLADFLSEDVITVVFEDQMLGTDDDDFNDTVVTIEPIDPAGTSLVFNGLTPDFGDVVETIASDPPAVEDMPQVDRMMVASVEPILPTVTVEPDPAIAA